MREMLGAASEAATGLIVMVAPAVFVRWLLGADLSGVGVVVGRLSGFALLALGMACWPDARSSSGHGTAIRAPIYLRTARHAVPSGTGLRGEFVGHLLWPAVMVHAVYTVHPVARGSVGREATSNLAFPAGEL